MTTFLLSPADCRGRRAHLLTRPDAAVALAVALREGRAPLGDVFSFVSGLYFRGKYAYARAFGRVSFVIAPGRGLLQPDARICTDHLHAFAQVDVDEDDASFVAPLVRDATAVARDVEGPIVLLGSFATPKYVEPLSSVFGARLLVPLAFVGQGDMRRGKMMLDAVRARQELAYGPVPARRRRG